MRYIQQFKLCVSYEYTLQYSTTALPDISRCSFYCTRIVFYSIIVALVLLPVYIISVSRVLVCIALLYILDYVV